MGIFDRVERGLERAVKAPFAKVFKAEVQPVEIASAMRGAMDDRAAVLGPGRTMVPNVFTVELAASDYERLASYDSALTGELVAAAEDHADAQRYTPAGTIEVRLTSDEELETGIFRVRPSSSSARRPQQNRPSPQNQPPNQQPRPGPQGPPPNRQQNLQQNPWGGTGGAAAAGGEGDTRAFRPPPAQPAPQQRTPHQPWLDINGRRAPLRAAVTTLGRDGSADIIIEDQGISRRHAEIRISHDGPHLQLSVRDLGSTNGTYVNGDQIRQQQLGDGDRVTLGRTTVTVHIDGGR